MWLWPNPDLEEQCGFVLSQIFYKSPMVLKLNHLPPSFPYYHPHPVPYSSFNHRPHPFPYDHPHHVPYSSFNHRPPPFPYFHPHPVHILHFFIVSFSTMPTRYAGPSAPDGGRKIWCSLSKIWNALLGGGIRLACEHARNTELPTYVCRAVSRVPLCVLYLLCLNTCVSSALFVYTLSADFQWCWSAWILAGAAWSFSNNKHSLDSIHFQRLSTYSARRYDCSALFRIFTKHNTFVSVRCGIVPVFEIWRTQRVIRILEDS